MLVRLFPPFGRAGGQRGQSRGLRKRLPPRADAIPALVEHDEAVSEPRFVEVHALEEVQEQWVQGGSSAAPAPADQDLHRQLPLHEDAAEVEGQREHRPAPPGCGCDELLVGAALRSQLDERRDPMPRGPERIERAARDVLVREEPREQATPYSTHSVRAMSWEA